MNVAFCDRVLTVLEQNLAENPASIGPAISAILSNRLKYEKREARASKQTEETLEAYVLRRISSREEWRDGFKARDLFMACKRKNGLEQMGDLLRHLDRLEVLGFVAKRPPVLGRGRPALFYDVCLDTHQFQESQELSHDS